MERRGSRRDIQADGAPIHQGLPKLKALRPDFDLLAVRQSMRLAGGSFALSMQDALKPGSCTG